MLNRSALLCACKVSPKLQAAVERPQEVCSDQGHFQLMHFWVKGLYPCPQGATRVSDKCHCHQELEEDAAALDVSSS